MNIREELLKEHSKRQMLKIASYAGTDPAHFRTLIALFLANEYRVTQRAAWVVSYCAQQYPGLIDEYLESMLDNLYRPVHDAVIRNTFRLLQDIDLPETLQGKAADRCFHFLSLTTAPVAVKVFAMTVLANIAKKEPALKNELEAIITLQLPYAKPAFTSRAKRVLSTLKMS